MANQPIISSASIRPSSGKIGTKFTADYTATGRPRMTITYRWRLNGINIGGARYRTYTAAAAGDLTVFITATNAWGSSSKLSPKVVVAAIAPLSPPTNTTVPSIAGIAQVGQLLSVTSSGTWTGNPVPSLTRNWQRNGVNISGATSTSYILVAGDSGANIRVSVTGTNSQGSVKAYSAAILVEAYSGVTVGTAAGSISAAAIGRAFVKAAGAVAAVGAAVGTGRAIKKAVGAAAGAGSAAAVGSTGGSAPLLGAHTIARTSAATVATSAGAITTSAANGSRLWHDRGEEVGVMVEETTTNLVPDNTATTSDGTTAPTGMNFYAAAAAITATVVGKGAENGIDYYDVRFLGSNSSGSTQFLNFATATRASLGVFNTGDPIVFSAYFKVTAGSIVGPDGYSMATLRINVYDNVDAYVTTLTENHRIHDHGELIREWIAGTCPSTDRRLEPHIGLTVANGEAVDFTLRIGLSQIERKLRPTTPVKTTGTTASRTAETMTVSMTNGTYTIYVERVGIDRQVAVSTYTSQTVSGGQWAVPASALPFVRRVSATTLSAAYPALGTLATNIGVKYGASCFYWDHLVNDVPQRNLMQAQTNQYGASFELKWWVLQPTDGGFDFADADAFVALAGTHGKAMRGHTMLWHLQLPAWLPAKLTSGNWQTEINNHFSQVCNRWPGLTSWDVVNEAVDDDGTYRNSIWYQVAGTAYVAYAFNRCAFYAPGIPRYYCDYGLEDNTPWAANKRSAVLTMLTNLVNASVPIDGLNLQAHLQFDLPYKSSVLRTFIQQVKALGLDVISTEIDVRGPVANTISAARYDDLAADLIRRYFDDLLAEGALEMMHWNLSDNYTWLDAQYPTSAPNRALPYDTSLNPKQMQAAIRQALIRAAP